MKYFEIRDSATHIPAVSFRFEAKTEKERYLIARCGYGRTLEEQKEHVMLVRLEHMKANYDPHRWGTTRTMTVAHHYIIEHWDTLSSGDVVDVQFILGETDKPKVSEMKKEWRYE